MRKGLIPLDVHAGIEPIAATVLIVAPWIFGVSDNGAATWFMIIAGVLELLTALSTRWEPVAVARSRRRPSGVSTAH